MLGYRALTASNGDEALVRFKQHADEIDLVITDRAMPGMMGTELALALRAIRANLPIIMITGGATDMVAGGIDQPLPAQAVHEGRSRRGHSQRDAATRGKW